MCACMKCAEWETVFEFLDSLERTQWGMSNKGYESSKDKEAFNSIRKFLIERYLYHEGKHT